jgi:hypothetical protein
MRVVAKNRQYTASVPFAEMLKLNSGIWPPLAMGLIQKCK